jgi:CRISPR-associated protein Cmr1
MCVIVVEYDVVTPMYLGGANQQPEWRVAAYANMLRWWWRALAYARFGGCLKKIKLNEALLFGRHEKPFGAGRVRFRDLSHTLDSDSVSEPPGWAGTDFKKWSGLSYLAGQGLSARGWLPRNRIKVEMRVNWRDVPLEASSGADHALSLDALEDAVKLIGLIGGLGARSRRGFGSLSLRCLKIDAEEPVLGPADTVGYAAMVKDAIGESTAGYPTEPDYSAIWSGTKIAVVATGSDARALMNELGFAFELFRNWGYKHPVDRDTGARRYRRQTTEPHIHLYRTPSGTEAIPAGSYKTSGFPERNPAGGWLNSKSDSYLYKADHDWSKRQPVRTGALPSRRVLGIPHNYESENINIDAVADGDNQRRASPLFFHFHALGQGRYAAVLALFRSRFLPDDYNVRVSPAGDVDSSVFQPTNGEWNAAEQFIAFTKSGQFRKALRAPVSAPVP